MSEMTRDEAIRSLYDMLNSEHTCDLVWYDKAKKYMEEAKNNIYGITFMPAGVNIKPVCNVGDVIFIVADNIPDGIEMTQLTFVEYVIAGGVETFKYTAPCVDGNGIWNFFSEDLNKYFYTDPKKAIAARDEMFDGLRPGVKIPFVTPHGKTIHYYIEKIKIREDGSKKIRCSLMSGKARSFTEEEARALIRTKGMSLT